MRAPLIDGQGNIVWATLTCGLRKRESSWIPEYRLKRNMECFVTPMCGPGEIQPICIEPLLQVMKQYSGNDLANWLKNTGPFERNLGSYEEIKKIIDRQSKLADVLLHTMELFYKSNPLEGEDGQEEA